MNVQLARRLSGWTTHVAFGKVPASDAYGVFSASSTGAGVIDWVLRTARCGRVLRNLRVLLVVAFVWAVLGARRVSSLSVFVMLGRYGGL